MTVPADPAIACWMAGRREEEDDDEEKEMWFVIPVVVGLAIGCAWERRAQWEQTEFG